MPFDDVYQSDLSQSSPNEQDIRVNKAPLPVSYKPVGEEDFETEAYAQNIRVNKAHLPVYYKPVGEEDFETEEEDTSDEGLMNFITRWFG
jgi:hypothetical protein